VLAFVCGQPFLRAVPLPEDRERVDAAIKAMGFVRIPKGVFWMGGGSMTPPTKQAEIKEDFEIAAYVVTQEQWQAVMGANPSHFSRIGAGKEQVKAVADADLNRFPVEQVTWDDVQEFLKTWSNRD